MAQIEKFTVGLQGHLLITEIDGDHRRVLLNQRNAINKENMGLLIARALTDRQPGYIYYMGFGTGGSTTDPIGNVLRNPPITDTSRADLYDPLFDVIVDDQSTGTTSTGYMRITHTAGTETTDAIIHAIMGKNSPVATEFSFNEIGLRDADKTLLTHVTFSPVQKKPNVIVEVIYTLHISIIVIEASFPVGGIANPGGTPPPGH